MAAVSVDMGNGERLCAKVDKEKRWTRRDRTRSPCASGPSLQETSLDGRESSCKPSHYLHILAPAARVRMADGADA